MNLTLGKNMKKTNLKKITFAGITAGTFFLAQTHAEINKTNDKPTQDHKNLTSRSKENQLTEKQLLFQLNSDVRAIYQQLDQEGKALALKLANQTCKGQNDCKGLNSCETLHNACSGQGNCKGTSPGPFKDNNDAVKVAAKHMSKKRESLMK